jgi:hypothetical protein
MVVGVISIEGDVFLTETGTWEYCDHNYFYILNTAVDSGEPFV